MGLLPRVIALSFINYFKQGFGSLLFDDAKLINHYNKIITKREKIREDYIHSFIDYHERDQELSEEE